MTSLYFFYKEEIYKMGNSPPYSNGRPGLYNYKNSDLSYFLLRKSVIRRNLLELTETRRRRAKIKYKKLEKEFFQTKTGGNDCMSDLREIIRNY